MVGKRNGWHCICPGCGRLGRVGVLKPLSLVNCSHCGGRGVRRIGRYVWRSLRALSPADRGRWAARRFGKARA